MQQKKPTQCPTQFLELGHLVALTEIRRSGFPNKTVAATNVKMIEYLLWQ